MPWQPRRASHFRCWPQRASDEEARNCRSSEYFGCLFVGLGDAVLGYMLVTLGAMEGLTGGVLSLASIGRHPTEVGPGRQDVIYFDRPRITAPGAMPAAHIAPLTFHF